MSILTVRADGIGGWVAHVHESGNQDPVNATAVVTHPAANTSAHAELLRRLETQCLRLRHGKSEACTIDEFLADLDGLAIHSDPASWYCAMAADKLREAEARARHLEDRFRAEWWIGHWCPVSALYGDDGEMQCHACRVDFKRHDFARLQEHVEARRLHVAQDALTSAEAARAPLLALVELAAIQLRTSCLWKRGETFDPETFTSVRARDDCRTESVRVSCANCECAAELEAALRR